MENDVVRCGTCNAPAGPGFREMHLTAEAERLFRARFPHLTTLPSPGGLCAACQQLSPHGFRGCARRRARAAAGEGPRGAGQAPQRGVVTTMFTPTEVECLGRALDPAAAPEWKPVARELIAALRARGGTVEDLIDQVPGDPLPDAPVMPWGKHRNRPLRLIDSSYLDWTLGWLKEDGERRRKFTDLIVAIEAVLATRASTRRSPAPSTAAKKGPPPTPSRAS